MEKFYFTYGTEGQPFKGGWSIVEAENYEQACAIFNIVHPKKNGMIDCAWIYAEDAFRKSFGDGDNFGEKTHEIITYSVKKWKTF